MRSSRISLYLTCAMCVHAMQRTPYLGNLLTMFASPASLVQYVNNPSLADISFIVDGKPFYAHRIALVASSDAFRVMFDGGYKEKVRCSA